MRREWRTVTVMQRNTHRGRRLAALLALLVMPVLLVIFAATATTERAETGGYSSLQDLDGKRIGVQTGTTFDAITKRRLPNV